MRREEARAGSVELQPEKGAKEKKPVEGRLRRGQRRRRKNEKGHETKREEGFEKEDTLTSPTSAERCCRIHNWKLPVGFGTEEVTGALVSTSSVRNGHTGQVRRAGQEQQVGGPSSMDEVRKLSVGERQAQGKGRVLLFSRWRDLI